MLLTSPLVVTVGLSLTIPLSLVGQMILDSQFSSFTYWLGAGIVFLSFIVVNHESKQEQNQESEEGTADRELLADASSLNR
jgi:solute carrier family 35, member F5